VSNHRHGVIVFIASPLLVVALVGDGLVRKTTGRQKNHRSPGS
jgi:hypothetical protein